MPRAQDLAFFGCPEGAALFADAVAQLQAIGGEAVVIDFSPFLHAARLLYEGPWVAERYTVVGPLLERDPEAVLPVIRAVLAKAPGATAVEAFTAQYQLQAFKTVCDATLAELDCVLTPTIGRPVTLAELYALAGGPPLRPGMVRVAQGGCAIEVEVWELLASERGTFVAGIPAPLGLGKVELADGRHETGFICEPCGVEGATDISGFGGWRRYLASR